jgi:hypothetical protein
MITLSRMTRFTRLIVFGILAFSGSLLLGETYLPSIEYFWALGSGRLLLCLALVYLPITDAGRFRPLLFLLSLAGLSSLYLGEVVGTDWVLVTLLYLSLEVAIDCLVLTNATEQEIPFELGWLAGWRLLGLWGGIFLQHSDLSRWTGRITLSVLGALTCFWMASRESQSDHFLPRGWSKSFPAARESVTEGIRRLAKPWSLAAAFNLFCFAFLTGYSTGAILPYPLLHPQGAGTWLTEIFSNLQVLVVGLLAMLAIERLRLRTQVALVNLMAWGLLLPGLILGQSIPIYLWGLLLTGILISTRVVLRETFSVDPVLKAAVVVTVWTGGGLLGELMPALSTATEKGVKVALLIAIITFATLCWRRYSQKARMINTPLPSTVVEARFGDRTQDFQGVPTERKKRKRFGRWRGRLNYLVVHLPVYIITLGLLFGGLRIGSYFVHNRGDWERRFDDATKTFRTELFFSAFTRRLTEEMLASQRVPKDWGRFIEDSFHSNGTPLNDIDLWNTPYHFQNIPGKVVIVCAGPDRLFDTPDDLTQEVPKPVGVP